MEMRWLRYPSVPTSGVKQRVQEFWQQSPCDSWFTDHQPGTSEFYQKSRRASVQGASAFTLGAGRRRRPRGLRVWEVGCGCGSDAERFARTASCRYTGIDPNRHGYTTFAEVALQLAGLERKIPARGCGGISTISRTIRLMCESCDD